MKDQTLIFSTNPEDIEDLRSNELTLFDNTEKTQETTNLDNFLNQWQEYCETHKVAGFLIEGDIELWNGHVDYFTVKTSVYETYRCIASRSIDYVEFYREGLEFLAEAHHHDGVNYFRIRPLQNAGLRSLEYNKYRQDAERLRNTLIGYSRSFFFNRNCFD